MNTKSNSNEDKGNMLCAPTDEGDGPASGSGTINAARMFRVGDGVRTNGATGGFADRA